MFRLTFLLVLLSFLPSLLTARQSVPAGTVVDKRGVPLPEVLIQLKGQPIGSTDTAGVFTLPSRIELPVTLELLHNLFIPRSITLAEYGKIYQLEPLSTELTEVVISSDYLSDTRLLFPTPAIDTSQIEQLSPVQLVPALTLVPGVNVQSGAINTNRISIRGMGARTPYGTNKLRAYYNGIPITNGVSETVLEVFDPENIEQIEVVKGPKAAQYGSSLGGALLLSSRLPESSSTGSSITVGSNGLLKTNVTANFSTDRLTTRFHYSRLSTDGFRENSSYKRSNYFLESTYRLNEKSEASLLLTKIDYKAYIASSIGATQLETAPETAAFTWGQAQGYEDAQQWLAGLSFTHRFSETFSNTTTVFYTYNNNYEPRPFNILKEYTRGAGVRSIFSGNFRFWRSGAYWSAGAEFIADDYRWRTFENLYQDFVNMGSVEGEELSNNREERNQVYGFASVMLPLGEQLTTQLALNVNKSRFYYNNLGEGTNNERTFSSIFAPSITLQYNAGPGTHLFVNTSRGFNLPSLEETLYPNGLVNPGIGPETGWSHEVGVEKLFLNDSLSMQLSLYRMSVQGLLVAARTAEDQFVGRNAGHTLHSGIELALRYTFGSKSFYSYSFR